MFLFIPFSPGGKEHGKVGKEAKKERGATIHCAVAQQQRESRTPSSLNIITGAALALALALFRSFVWLLHLVVHSFTRRVRPRVVYPAHFAWLHRTPSTQRTICTNGPGPPFLSIRRALVSFAPPLFPAVRWDGWRDGRMWL